ncbi:MAG: hypothetical protein IT198_10580 [Acidimicrobiia bacterium]|nr:hypothetical protein [Acidimicrobiia bacterium]
MDTLTRAEMNDLMAIRGGPCVSIMMPTHRAGADRDQDPIRFRNLLKTADHQLRETDVRGPDAEALLASARELGEDDFFWDHLADSLVVFVDPAGTTVLRLTVPLEELVTVGDRHTLTPLIPAMDPGTHFYLLALSENDVRFLKGGRFGMGIVDLPDAPDSLSDAFKYTLFEHPGTRGIRKRRPGIFKGHSVGGKEVEDMKQIRAYFKQVDNALQHVLAGKTAPLVLAGVEYLMDAYRSSTAYRYVLPEGIHGNPDRTPVPDLHKAGWALVEPVLAESRRRDLARIEEALGRGQGSASLKEILPAAAQGRVELIAVAAGAHEWGRVDESGNVTQDSPEQRPGDEDLLDHAALRVWTTDGTVYVVPREEVPGGGPVAARHRY